MACLSHLEIVSKRCLSPSTCSHVTGLRSIVATLLTACTFENQPYPQLSLISSSGVRPPYATKLVKLLRESIPTSEYIFMSELDKLNQAIPMALSCAMESRYQPLSSSDYVDFVRLNLSFDFSSKTGHFKLQGTAHTCVSFARMLNHHRLMLFLASGVRYN